MPMDSDHSDVPNVSSGPANLKSILFQIVRFFYIISHNNNVDKILTIP